MFLGSEEIRKLIKEQNMVSNFGLELDEQIQPNGIDLTLEKIERFCGPGEIYIHGKFPPQMQEILPDIDGETYHLSKGSYLIYFNETIKLPKGIAAIHIQRSTLMRYGTFTIVGSWDSGYHGKGCSLLLVSNEDGLTLERNARVVQMHFIPVSGELFAYNGNYQNENIQR